MELVWLVYFSLIGLVVGSFLNVCIDRLPSGKSVIHPPSFCDSCLTPLKRTHMVPVFSYLWLRGRCGSCQALIPRRVLVVEILGGLIFGFSCWYFWRGGLTVQFALFTFYFLLLTVVFFVDLEQHLILNKVIYPAAIVVMLVDVVMPRFGITQGIPQPVVSWLPLWLPQPAFLGGLPSGILGGAMGFVFLFIPALIYPAGMGWGDIKFAALMGLMLGFGDVLVALLLGVVMGGLVATGLLIFRRKKRGEGIPFGPFLVLGTAATLLWGQNILHWYLNVFFHV